MHRRGVAIKPLHILCALPVLLTVAEQAYVVITPLGVVCPGAGNITVSCTTQGSDVQVWSASGVGIVRPLYMGYNYTFPLPLNYSCTLSLLYKDTSGQVMISNMTCPALVEMNGTVFTCKTGGGEMNQTTLWFVLCPSPPPQPKQPGNGSALHVPPQDRAALALGVAMVVIIAVIIPSAIIVFCCVKKRTEPSAQNTTPSAQNITPSAQNITPTACVMTPPAQQGTNSPSDIATIETDTLEKADMVFGTDVAGGMGRSHPSKSASRRSLHIDNGDDSCTMNEKISHFPVRIHVMLVPLLLVMLM